MSRFQTTLHRFGDTPLTVEYDAEPYIPARVSGPPEHCHPAEGGTVEIIAVRDEAGAEVEITPDERAELQAEAAEHFADEESAREAAWADMRNDEARMERYA